MPVFTCQGIPSHGVILTPPTAAEFPHLLQAIRTRSRERIDGAPPAPDLDALQPEDLHRSAILLNYSEYSILQAQARWTVLAPGAPPWIQCQGLLGQMAVVPLRPTHPLTAFWHTIMPGSVRLLTREHLFGNNLDVRLPRPEELHLGGWIQGHGGSPKVLHPEAIVDLSLDAVVFEDGGFVGEDRCGLWQRVSADAQLKSEAAMKAKEALVAGRRAANVLEQLIGEFGGGDSQHDVLGRQLVWARDHGEGEELLQALLRIADLPQPLIRRL